MHKAEAHFSLSGETVSDSQMKAYPVNTWEIFFENKFPDFLIVVGLVDEIQLFYIQDQDRVSDLAFEKLKIAVLQVLKICLGDPFLIGAFALSDIVQQLVCRSVEIHKQVRIGKVAVEDIKKALEQPVLLYLEVFSGENEGLPKTIVSDGKVGEKVTVHEELLQLFVPFGHEEELYGESIPVRIFIKIGQKGIVGKLLKDELAVIFPGE